MLLERCSKLIGLGAGLMLAVCGELCPGRALAAEEQSARPVSFEGAVANYKGGDLTAAERDFLLLAETGLATADLNLGVMAARGDLRAPDMAEALGWLTAARQLGAQVSDAQLSEFSSGAGPQGQSKADAIVGHYGREAVANRLKEALLACRQSSPTTELRPADRVQQTAMTPPRTLEMGSPNWAKYPEEGLKQGFPASVFIRFLIDVDGKGKHPVIASSFPISWREGFQEAANKAVLHGRYAPATVNGQPVAAWKTMQISFRINGIKEMIEAAATKKLRAAAAQEDPAAEALWVVLSDAGVIDYKERMADSAGDDAILVSSALRGFAQSEAVLFQRLCVPQHRAVWRMRAASDGAPTVLGPIVVAAYTRMFEPAERSEIIRLLDKAAGSEDPSLVREAAWVRASARDPYLRDAPMALRLALSLHPERRTDPDYDLALAAAQAAGGDFDAARATQESALRKAEQLGWNVAPLQRTLRSYESKQPDSSLPSELQPCTQAQIGEEESRWAQQCLQR
jgi:hypothetical protein